MFGLKDWILEKVYDIGTQSMSDRLAATVILLLVIVVIALAPWLVLSLVAILSLIVFIAAVVFPWLAELAQSSDEDPHGMI